VEGKPAAPEWIRRRWEKATRYYEVYLHPDLWGDWVLTRIWGRRGELLGRECILPVPLTRRVSNGWRRCRYGDSNEAMCGCRARPGRNLRYDMISYHTIPYHGDCR
jgi:hypothetical protein